MKVSFASILDGLDVREGMRERTTSFRVCPELLLSREPCSSHTVHHFKIRYNAEAFTAGDIFFSDNLFKMSCLIKKSLALDVYFEKYTRRATHLGKGRGLQTPGISTIINCKNGKTTKNHQ